MPTDASMDQSRRIAAEMAHWLVLFDEELALDEVPLGDRPMQALFKLFEYEAIQLDGVGDQITKLDIGEHAQTVWFRVLYAAVEYWYVDQFGPTAMKRSGNAPLEGVILIRNVAFALRFAANRRKVHIEGEQTWMYFEEGLGEDEIAHHWIVDGPDLSKLSDEDRAEVEVQAVKIASTLRYVEFRRVTALNDANEAARQLVVNTLASLQQSARRMVGGYEAERGPGWYDLQMANESALKAVLRLRTGSQPKIHDLAKLLEKACAFGVTFDAERLDDLPKPGEVAEWRYGQGQPWRLERQYRAYLTTLDLVRAAMNQVPAGIIPGFGVLLRYPPWLSDTGRAER